MSSALDYALKTFNPDGSRRPGAALSKSADPRFQQARRVIPQIAGAAAAQSGNLPPPANAAAAAGNSPLNVPQAAMVVGEPIPVIWGRRRGNVGGVLVFPRATEARFENNSTTITIRYHMVLGEGLFPDIQRRDVRFGECRIGSFSQNYDKRAGSWTPGNFATTQTTYTVPVFPTYTGGGGNYQGLSTFEAGATFTGGSDDWRTAWNVFLRGGTIVERGRLIDSTVASSDNIADLVLWALQRSGRAPDAMIDFPSMLAAATFTEAVGMWCNGEFNASVNLGDWLIRILPDFLLRETKVGGKFGLRPLLPTNANGTINTGTIEPQWMITESAIIPGSYQIEYSDAASRRPVAMAMLWRQQHDDTDVPIVRTLTVGDPNASGPVEQHDLSQFATNETHAVKVGAYLYARRTLSTHTATVRLKPGSQTGTISEGDILQIYLGLTTSREPAGAINHYYQVESISHSLTGEETLALSHFPVNSEGQSLIALAVANATGPGIIYTSNRTGGSCDLAGASSSTEVPGKSSVGTPLSPPGIDVPLSLGGPDSPPGPGANPIASTGGPTTPVPPISGPGGDAICPYGYSQVTGTWRGGELPGGGFGLAYCQDPKGGFTSTGFPDVEFSAIKSGNGYTYQDVTIRWNDPTEGFKEASTASILFANDPSNSFECIFKIEASSYSCKLASGAAGTTVTARLYKVMEGDTMALVSKKMYGTTARASDILAANPVPGFTSTLAVADYWLMWPGRILSIPT